MKAEKFTPPLVRHPFQRERTPTVVVGESRTHQSHKAACDIQEILKRFDNTGTVPGARPPGSYVDCTALQNKDKFQLIVESRADLEAKARRVGELQKQAADKDAAERKAEKEELVKLREQVAKTQEKPDVK